MSAIQTIQQLDNESPASHCVRFMESIAPKIRAMAEIEESTPKERHHLTREQNEKKRLAVLNRMKEGMGGHQACALNKVHVSMFRRTWFPNGVCRHEGFEGMEWKK